MVNPFSELGRIKTELERQIFEKAGKLDLHHLERRLDDLANWVHRLESEKNDLVRTVSYQEDEISQLRNNVSDLERATSR